MPKAEPRCVAAATLPPATAAAPVDLGPLGLSPTDYAALIGSLAARLAVVDGDAPDQLDDFQRESDRETAEWFVAQLYAAGYVPRPCAPEPTRPKSGLLTMSELALSLGIPRMTLAHSIRAMRRDDGFPEPVPGSGGRYDPIAVTAWRRRRAGLVAAIVPSNFNVLNDVDGTDGWAAELDRRSATIGAA